MPRQSMIKIRSGTTAQWNAADTASTADPERLLAAGEPGRDTTTGVLKIGDGTTKFADLPGYVDESKIAASFVAFIDYGTDVNTPRGFTGGKVFWSGDRGAGFPVNAEPQDTITIPAPDETAPTTPASLTATVDGADVDLAWAAATDADGVAGYRVYRSTTTGFTPGPGTLRHTSAGGGLAYTDPAPAAGTWFYKVTAYDDAGNESTASPEASATIAAPQDFTPFVTVTDWHTAWWAHDMSAADGSAVTALTDGSGNGRNFTDFDSDTTRRPVFAAADATLGGKPAVVFDGVNDGMKTAAFTAVAQPWSFCLVGYEPSGSGTRSWFDAANGTTSRGRHQRGSNNLHSLFAGATLSGSATNAVVMFGTFNGTSSKLNVNGTEVSGDTGPANAITQLFLGFRRDATWPANLHLAFFGIVPRAFTSGEFAALKAGAANHYGLTVV